jgi:hypothetical protein
MVFRARMTPGTHYFVFHADGRYAHITRDLSTGLLAPLGYGRWRARDAGLLLLKSEAPRGSGPGEFTARRVDLGDRAALVSEDYPPIAAHARTPGQALTRFQSLAEGDPPAFLFLEMDVEAYEKLRLEGYRETEEPDKPVDPPSAPPEPLALRLPASGTGTGTPAPLA